MFIDELYDDEKLDNMWITNLDELIEKKCCK